jgi:hypothetical protein
MYQRWDMFTEILRQAIEVSECDKEKSLHLVECNNARQKFYYAISVRDKAMMKQTIKAIRKNGKASLKEKLLYLKCMLKG